MKIAIAGAGAMGSLYGGRLAQGGEQVWLLDSWEEHVRAVNEDGLMVVAPEGTVVLRLPATTRAEDVGVVDLVIIMVKANATRQAANIAAGLVGPATMVLTLQNGLGNAEKLAEVLGAQRVIVGTTAMGAMMLGPGRVRDGGKGATHIGKLDGHASREVYEIAATFSRSGLYTTVASNLPQLLWGKLALNAALNPVSAITGLTNGQLAECDDSVAVMKKVLTEVEAVAKAQGIQLPYDNPLEHLLGLMRSTCDNRTSMLQDILRKRPTEIAALNGEVIKLGQRFGIPTSTNETLIELVKTVEKNY